MKIDEIVISQAHKTWELVKNTTLVSPVYNAYAEISTSSRKFTVRPELLFNEFELTDLIIDYQTYKIKLMEVFAENDQVVKIIDRIISYLEYGELNE